MSGTDILLALAAAVAIIVLFVLMIVIGDRITKQVAINMRYFTYEGERYLVHKDPTP